MPRISGPISREQAAAYLDCDPNQINPDGLRLLNIQLATFGHKYYIVVHDDPLGTTYDGIEPVVKERMAELLMPIDCQE